MLISDVKRRFEMGIASRPYPGELVLGDHYLTRFDPDRALFAVIDGAGHGVEASIAAHAAEAVLLGSSESSPGKLLSLCSNAIRSTRGAAISLASIDLSDSSMSWAGVGNVEGAFLRRNKISKALERETLLLRNGIVGYEFTPPRVSTLSIENGDLLIFATDGVGSFFLEGINPDGHSQSIADSIVQVHGKDSDDVLVMVVRMIEGFR